MLTPTLTQHSTPCHEICWEPFHLQEAGRPRLASAFQDSTVRVWDTVRGVADIHLARHTSTISCVRWNGTRTNYTASHDKTVKLWDGQTEALLRSLDAHAHWVNHLALSSDSALRTAFHNHTKKHTPDTDDGKRARALQRFETATRVNGAVTERIVTPATQHALTLGRDVARQTHRAAPRARETHQPHHLLAGRALRRERGLRRAGEAVARVGRRICAQP